MHVLNRFLAAQRFVPVELVLPCIAVPDAAQPFGQVPCIVDTAVEPHPTLWVVEMRGVAGEEGAPLAVGLRDPLMNGVDTPHLDIGKFQVGDYLSQARLDALVAEDFVGILVVEQRLAHAPQIGDTQNMPVMFRVGHVVHIGEVWQDRAQIERCAHHQDTLGKGEPREIDVEHLAHRAPAAIGADQVVGAQRHVVARTSGGDRDAIVVLVEPGDFVTVVKIDAGHL